MPVMMSSAAVPVKTFRASRKPFRDRAQNRSPSRRNPVRLHPGILFALPRNPHILVAIEAVDGRKGIDTLARLCQEKFQSDPFSSGLFVFRSRRGTLIRILVPASLRSDNCSPSARNAVRVPFGISVRLRRNPHGGGNAILEVEIQARFRPQLIWLRVK